MDPMVRLTAMTALLLVLAALQWAGLLFPRGADKARELCDDYRKLDSAFLADVHFDNATPAETAELLRDYLDRLVPCRKGELEGASTVHPALVAILAESYARRDHNLLQLVTGRMSWKAWRGEDEAIAAWAASRAELFRDRLTSGEAGFARSDARHEATLSLQDWADRQRALIQQQSAIDSKVQTRLTTCRYDGVVLHCTTS
jgi:hypothetical protein